MQPSCPLCGSNKQRPGFRARDYEHGVPGEWTIVACDSCGLYYQSPLPQPADIPSFYPPTYSAYNTESPRNDPLSLMFRFVYWLDARRIAGLIGRDGRILDIGCGDGSALLKMKEFGRWELHGLELDEAAVKKARERGLNNVQAGDVVDCSLPDNSFDLIRMGHVIEHVLNPHATVERVQKLLRPGGVLFGETPNTDCLDFQLFGRYWGPLHIPRHLIMFNSQNLRGLLEKTGFTDVRISSRMRTVGWSCGIQNILVDRFGLKVPVVGRVSWYPLLIVPFLPVTFLQSLFGATATIAFTARKPV